MTALLLGLILGVQHATDPDHVIAVATIAATTRRLGAAALVGACWGAGHTFTMSALGVAIVVFDLAVTPRMALSLELAVALMLMVLGTLRILWVFSKSDAVPLRHLGEPHAPERGSALYRRRRHAHGTTVHRHPHVHPPARLVRALEVVGAAQALRSAAVGVVHGLAGTAAVALLALTTIHTTAGAVGYLILFGIGTVLGMVAITGLLSLLLAMRVPRARCWREAVALATGMLSLGFGLYLVVQIGFAEGLFLAHGAGALR